MCKKLRMMYSVLPALLILPAMADKGPLATNGMELSGTYKNGVNDSSARAGAYTVDYKTSGVTVADGTTFSNNVTLVSAGGALKLLNGIQIGDDVKFINNRTEDKGFGGGAMYIKLSRKGTQSPATKVEIGDHVNFRGNTSALGGAIALEYGDLIVGQFGLFDNNTATNGGAVAIWHDEEHGDLHSSFVADTVTFKQNSATVSGGAIANADAGAHVLLMNSSFDENSAAIGGAIANAGRLGVMNDTFTGNTASKNGGAIYNESTGNTSVWGSKFVNNSAAIGGAIANNAGGLDIDGGTFVDNTATSMGGAIYSQGAAHITIKNSEFKNNHALYFGALGSGSVTEVSNTLFENNTADEVGAVGFFTGAALNNVTFRNNHATSGADDSDGSGALFLGATSKTVLYNVTFDSNTSAAVGGAVSTRAADVGNNQDARLDIIDSKFMNNVAARDGGAFNNYLYSSIDDDTAVTVRNTEFTKNTAARGGAVFNHGAIDRGGNAASMKIVDSVFADNIAIKQGGAVFNESGLTFGGNNVFSGNSAAGIANDIYNSGTIVIADGTTRISGGIDGDGALTVSNGATLDMGTTTISQSDFVLDGTVLAAIKDPDTFARIYASSITGSGTIRLTDVYGVGTYDMFGADNDIFIDAGLLYNATNNGASGVVISFRPVKDIASDAGVGTHVAATVVGLGGRDDMADVALMARKMLESGDTDVLVDQVGRAHPDDRPVLHSATTSLQNQILNLAADRMVSVGRAGGDLTMGGGLWARGLFNKAKYDDVFHAYSRGMAFGADVLINRALTLGAGYARNTSDVHGNDRDVDIDGNTFFVYAGYRPSAWYVNATLSYSMADYEENTSFFGMPLNAKYDVDSFGAQIATGYDFASGMSPELGLRYLRMAQGDYENGLVRVNGTDSEFMTAVAGLRYAFDIVNSAPVKWRPELRAAATYDFLSDDVFSTVTMPGVASYRVDGRRLSRMGGEFGIGATATYGAWQLSLNYELDLHRDYTSQTGMARFRYIF